MKSVVKERLEDFLKFKKITKTEFGKRIGVSAAYVTGIRRSLSQEKISSIAREWPDLNIEWLLTGEGEMLKGQSGHTVVTGDVSGNGNHFVAGNNNHIATPAPKSEDVEVIDSEEVEIKETIILTPEIINQEGLDIRKELKAGTLDVQIKPTQDVLPPHELKIYTENDEMAPDVEVNDPVFARPIPEPRLFKPRYMYFVDLDIGGVVRWVDWDGDSRDRVRLISRKAIDVVPLASVKSMSEVVAITKRPKTLPIDLATAEQKMDRKESQLEEMFEHQRRLIGIIEDQIKDR